MAVLCRAGVDDVRQQKVLLTTRGTPITSERVRARVGISPRDCAAWASITCTNREPGRLQDSSG